ncbi:hypothetical protein AX17_005962 [Amanita inopinata Kibby_2008]|nr:hypothetical protein AX17_005962 [Amanita inopinata Kibby_2008]
MTSKSGLNFVFDPQSPPQPPPQPPQPCWTLHTQSSSDPRYCSRDSQNSSRTVLGSVPEEQEFMMDDTGSDSDSSEWIWDKELERQGLYRGSYRGFVALYTFTPFTTLIAFILFALLPSIAYPLEGGHKKEHYPPYFPFPLPELLISIAFSSSSHFLRTPVFSLASLATSIPFVIGSQCATRINTIITFISCAVHTALAVFLRVTSFALLMPVVNLDYVLFNPAISTQNPAFRSVWWTALGWSMAEAAIGIVQGYQAIAQYKDVLISVRRTPKRNNSDIGAAANSSKFDADNNVLDHAAHDVPGVCNQIAIGKGKQAAVMTDSPDPTHEPGSYGSRTGPNVKFTVGQAACSLDVAGEREPLLRRHSNVSVVTSSSFASLSLGHSLEHNLAWDNPVEEGIDDEESELQMQVDRDIDQLLAFRSREEIEAMYGMPFIKIPVFISCMHRVNSLLLSIGLSLMLGAAYIHALLPPSDVNLIDSPLVSEAFSPHPIRILTTTVYVLHLLLAVLHTPTLLPKLGVHTVVYVSSMVALGTLFVALAVWGGLS